MRIIADILKMFLKDSQKYHRVKNQNPKSAYFGTAAIIYPLLGLILGGGAVFFALKIFNGLGNSGNVLTAIFLVIAAAALGLGGALGCLLYLIRGFALAGYQLKLQKKALGFAALAVNFLIFAAVFVLIILLVKNSP